MDRICIAPALFAQVSAEFVVGALVGMLLLLAGLGVGLWVGGRLHRAVRPPMNPLEVAQLLAGLTQWAQTMAADVSQYKQVMDVAGEQMRTLQKEPANPAMNAARLMSQVQEANDLLQARLRAAEGTLQRQSEELSFYLCEARTDGLTGLPNRRAFDEEFRRRMAVFARQGTPFELLILDVDHFKAINDTHGHPIGDAVLSQLGAALHEILRETDFIARYGGEEIVILLPPGDRQQVQGAVERIREALANTEFGGGKSPFSITASLGGAEPQKGEAGPTLLKRADEALYAAKQAGRDCAYWHDGTCSQPLVVRETSAAAPDLAAVRKLSQPLFTAEFGELCADLKRRLLEATNRN